MQTEINNEVLTIQPSQTLDAGQLQVTAPASTLQAAASVPGSNVTLALIAPDGKTYTDQTPGVKVTSTGTGEILDIPNPESGTWDVQVDGQNIAPGGEPVSVTAYPVTPAPPRPTVQISATPVAGQPNTYDLTATGSGALSYDWTFSDGASAEGATVTHAFTNTGDIWAKSTVPSQDGNTGSTSTDLGWVGPPVNTGPPAISGTPIQGQVLAAEQGAWSGNPTSYDYQWEQCDGNGANCSPIDGATRHRLHA